MCISVEEKENLDLCMYSDKSIGWPSKAFTCKRKSNRIKNRVQYGVDFKAF